MAQFTASIKINAVENLTKTARRIAKSTAKMRAGFEKLGKSIKKIGSGFRTISRRISLLGGVVGAALAVMIKNTADFGDSLDKTTQKVGVLSSDLQRLRLAVRIGGGSTDDADKAIRFLSRSMAEASEGMAEYRDAFESIGVEFQDAEGKLRKPLDVMLDIADVFSVMEDGSQKTADSMAIMGRAGTNMIPFLNQGRKGFDEVSKRLRFFNTELDDKQAANFNDQVEFLKTNLGGLVREQIKPLLPVLAEDIKLIENKLPKFNEFLQSNIKLKDVYADLKEKIKGVDFKQVFDVSVEKVKGVLSDLGIIIEGIADAIRFVRQYSPKSALEDFKEDFRVATGGGTPSIFPPFKDEPQKVELTVHSAAPISIDRVDEKTDVFVFEDIGAVTP
jgi:uncharacterized phage infection (PIP) family protein YhgE